MTDVTTIKLSKDAKAKLDDAQAPGETYEDTVLRLIGESPGKMWTEEEIYEIATKAARDECSTSGLSDARRDAFLRAIEEADEGSTLLLDETASEIYSHEITNSEANDE